MPAKAQAQAKRLERCRKQLGSGPSSLNTGIAMLVGNARSLLGAPAGGGIVKAPVFNYAFEHFEIASHRCLIAAAKPPEPNVEHPDGNTPPRTPSATVQVPQSWP
ncbi:DUF892 family protein [Azospirillum picis]|uniref:DUF892 family protein n=1 Tax=Azospirillum picis TaxID=488438 RepID=UPI002484BB14|nr:DUF892 family protein [Azospirillum picis]